MECSVITTYRCNAKCAMCRSWAHPSKSLEEFDPKILEKLPPGMTRLNITGGEPALREDLMDIVSVLDTKTGRLEISTNGYFTERLVRVAGQFPGITIRISVEGLPKLNDELRGIKDGFDILVVASTPAQVTGNSTSHFLLIRLWIFVKQSLSRHQHTGGAESALKGPVIEEGLLQGMQLIFLCNSFYGFDVFSLSLNSEN